jgi:isopenicillin-N N-acyltransferase like protein
MTGKLRILELSGTHYEIGRAHGEAYHDAIHKFTEERLHLSSSADWTGRSLSREAVLELGEACLDEHLRYAPALIEEIRGMADVTGLSMASLVIMNGFTDFVDVVYNAGASMQQEPVPNDGRADHCTAFLVPNAMAENGRGFYGQTWDMHASATPYVILMRIAPDDAPRALVFTVAGCIGMIGMNDAGIAVGINNIMALDGQIGVTWPFVIRQILRQTRLEDALACITEARLAGAHNYLLMDRHGQGYNIEAMPTRHQITPLDGSAIAHTNHCVYDYTRSVEKARTPDSQLNSERRLITAQTGLQGQRDVTPEMLMALTRDPMISQFPTEPMHVETCGAAVMRPATGDFWAVWGRPSEHDYEHFVV